MNYINIDLTERMGKIKPLHSVCCAPYSIALGQKQDIIDKYFKEANIPYCRLHDCCGGYGGTYFVDITNVFREFNADENNPENYDFHYTDEYVSAIQQAGGEAYYRLGETIEWGSRRYRTVVPDDFKKWARICEHIIRHYNEGWANGFEYNIKYWEIWNEPDNPGGEFGNCMWSGTKEQFFELYEVTSKHLRDKLPNIKIGGYGSCGFYALTRENVSESYKAFVPFFTDFLSMVKEKDCPLDFFSWHIYTLDEKEILAHAKFVRETLDKYGFENVEAHLNEWNISDEGTGFSIKHSEKAASFLSATMCMLQNTDYVDMAMYYCFSFSGRYNGLLDQNDTSVSKPWYSMVAFGEVYKHKNSVRVDTEKSEIYATASADKDGGAILLSNYSCDDDEVELSIKSQAYGELEMFKTDKESNMEKIISFSLAQGETRIKLKLSKYSVVLLKLK